MLIAKGFTIGVHINLISYNINFDRTMNPMVNESRSGNAMAFTCMIVRFLTFKIYWETPDSPHINQYNRHDTQN